MALLDRAAWDGRIFFLLVGAALAVKLLLAVLLPLTGDEAYFLQYARHVDWGGFYDHPPMVGWLLWLMERLGSHPLVLRLPAIVTGLVLAGGVYVLARGIDEQRARLVALLLLFTPAYLVNVLITSDTGLILFGFLSALALHQALRRQRPWLYAAAGILLGLAFLSKYFAVLLGLAFVALWPRLSWPQRRGLILLLACVLPFGLLNIVWNYHNCWNHIMFNVHNRTGGGFDPGGLPLYLLTGVYLFALPLWYLWRDRHFLRQEGGRDGLGLLAAIGIIPLLVFLPVSLFATIGLHWLLLFVPLVYPLYVLLSQEDLVRCLRFMVLFGVAHFLVLAALLLVPLQAFDGRDFQRDAIFYLQPDRYAAALADFEADYYAMDSYSRAAVLSYYSGRHWRVFGTGSVHAREDDRLTDWRRLDGGSLLYASRRHDIDTDDLAAYFDRVEVHTVTVSGRTFDVAHARGFDYAAYRDHVLADIRARYYDLPDYLPAGRCPFLERYFDDDSADDAGQALAYNARPC